MQELSADGPRRCEFCGDPLRKGVRKETRFCSSKCSYDRRVAEGWKPAPNPSRTRAPRKERPSPCKSCGIIIMSKANPGGGLCQACRLTRQAERNRRYVERWQASGLRPPSRALKTEAGHTRPVDCIDCDSPLEDGYLKHRCPPCVRAHRAVKRRAKKARRRPNHPGAWQAEKPCIKCALTFTPRAPTQSYCSKACREGHGDAVHCRDCGIFLRIRAPQVGPGAGGPQLCTPCRREAKREHARRRSYRLRGAAAGQAPYTRAQIAERDRWRCHLCGRTVRKDKTAPHPLAPTTDHLIPIACDGVDGADNVALAHFLCNSKRGTRGEVQLLLVG